MDSKIKFKQLSQQHLKLVARKLFSKFTLLIVVFKIFQQRGTKGILLFFFQKTRMLQSRGVVTLFHLFTIAIQGRNCFDMQH